MEQLQAGSWSDIWDTVFSNQEWGKYPSEAVVRFVARNFYKRDRAKTRLLEVGCGPGANIWFMSREGFSTFGIDASKVALELAMGRLAAEGLAANLIEGDILQLPFEDNFFDGAVDCECIYTNNTENSRRILCEISRVLKPGGKLFSQTFSNKTIGELSDPKGNEILEFEEVKVGPLAGKGFGRMSSRASIEDLYGRDFGIVSVDLIEATGNNGAYLISEWSIVAEKRR